MEEKLPLLEPGPKAVNGNGSSSGSGECSLNLGNFRVGLYGSNNDGRPTGRILSPSERVTYSWNEINVFTKLKNVSKRRCFDFFRKEKEIIRPKHILKNVCGVANPGELLAILGASGTGKTTLLNTLTFRNCGDVTVSGLRCINGIPASPKTLASQAAYVQQNDLFIGNLTVKEHLIFQALVRMERQVSQAQRIERVNEVITELALSRCENTQIGVPGRVKGISGGEMKRLSFASELLTNPCLMFCDEPTSGLDSFMALNVVQVLKGMAKSGKTVICTIHQPSSEIYAMFDKILLMAEGRTAFLGSPPEAEEFFRELEAPCPKNYNPADYYIQLLAIVPEREESCRQAVNLVCDKFQRSQIGAKLALEAADTTVKDAGGYYEEFWDSAGIIGAKSYKVSWWAQFRAVLWRSWLTAIKEPLLMKIRVIQTCIIALVISSIFFGQSLNQDGVMNINGALFLFLTTMTFQNCFAVVHVFCAELPVFLRENQSGLYRTDVYFLCKNIAGIPLFLALPIIYTAICYYLIGLNPEFQRFLICCGILILISQVSVAFGYLISCASANVAVALSVGPPLIVPFLLFGGFFLNKGSIPFYLEWLSYISWFKYGNEALLINQWSDVNNIECNVDNSTCPATGHVVLEIYNFNEENLVFDVVALTGLALAFRFVAFLALLTKTAK